MYATDQAVAVSAEQLERFIDRVELLANGCWRWRGCLAKNGYGRFSVGRGKNVAAHRYAWLWLKGPIPEGLVIDHLCRNRDCVNPEHLEPVEQRENLHRGLQFDLKTHCKHGHEYVAIKHGNNLWCRDCKKAHDHKMWLHRKARLHAAGTANAMEGARHT
jgi:hypothetical protein